MNKSFEIRLAENWKIQSSDTIQEKGSDISLNPNLTKDWHNASVPSTVLGTLVTNKVYENPFFGENIGDIPTELFQVPWWYVTPFDLSAEQASDYASICLDGINYKANVWLNGQCVADSNSIDGAFRITSFDISKHIIAGTNILAIEVIPPKPGDFSIGFVDWNPAAPDGNIGVFRPVTIQLHGGINLEKPFVQTKVNLETLKEAAISVSTHIVNYSDATISGVLSGKIGTVVFNQNITIKANSEKEISFAPEDFPQLNFKDPKLWWPIHLGKPNLYELELEFQTDHCISKTAQVTFGIREVEDYWLDEIHRGYIVNGEKVLIKGAGWTDDLFLMDTHESIETQVLYVKQMNLNCIRLEGFWGKDHKLYDLCDAHGILLMVGWSCHWEHEIHMGIPVSERFGAVYKPEDVNHVAQAWEDQVIWLRNHPSIFVWTVASDKVPITELEEKYIETFAKYDSTRPYLNSTGGVGSDQHVIGSEEVISEISGLSGVKMLGPYAYTAPNYWYTDTKFGGAYGFNTETGPGAQVPQLDSLKKMIPEEDLWPIGKAWDYHCGRYEFSDLSRFTTAINERYGVPKDLIDFDKKAQAMNYELMRPMFEAFQVNKKKSTGIIQWMLNAAWPKMYWQLYDYYLMPTGAFYATQKACTPVHLIYNYGDHQIYAINDHQHEVENLQALIRIYDIESKLILEKSISLNAETDSAFSIFSLENIEIPSKVYFVDLRMLNGDKTEISTNFYWLSTQEEILDYEADLGEFAYHTPSKQYADLRLLETLEKVDLAVSQNIENKGDQEQITVTLENKGNSIAFLINLNLVEKGSDKVILPVFWEDNFISLLQGEKRSIRATYNSDSEVELKVEGWNINNI